jgi:hypothetical protein
MYTPVRKTLSLLGIHHTVHAIVCVCMGGCRVVSGLRGRIFMTFNLADTVLLFQFPLDVNVNTLYAGDDVISSVFVFVLERGQVFKKMSTPVQF